MARLLIADNSKFYRQLLKESLQDAGHEVRTVADGSAALEAVLEESFDAVVLDLVMPRMNGARACQQIKRYASTRSLPVIILSGLREDEIDDADEIGADAFVAKMQATAMVEHLKEALDELLSGRLQTPRRGFDAMHRREVVTELLEERRSRETLLGSLSEGILRISETDRVIEANPAALAMLEMDEALLVNRPIAELLGCDADSLTALFTPGGGETRAVRRFRVGEHVVAVRGLGGGRDDDRFLLLSDVTDEIQTEQTHKILEDRINDTARASSLGEIVAGVAHELKNPLTAILGYAELLLQSCPDDRSRARLEKLDHAAQRCRTLIDGLLCFAGKRKAYRRAHDLNAVVGAVIDARKDALAEAGVTVCRELHDNLPPAWIDATQIDQVLIALLDNAMQALSSRPAGDRQVVVRTRHADDRLILEVQDSGPGIPVGSRERIFEPFFTTRRPEGGSGLGLAVAYGIIEEHGGRVQALDATPGALLRVELPLATAHLDAAAVSEVSDTPTVLVVDQQPVAIDLVEDILTEVGFRVERAANGAQALERITEVSFAAILIDVKGADVDGRHLFEAIQRRRPDLAARVVFTTDDPDSPVVASLIADTSAALLPKPFLGTEVAETCLALSRK